MRKNWETRKLGEVCDFEGGSQPPKSNFIFEPRRGYVRFLQIRDFGSDKYVTYIPESKKNRLCQEDDVLLGRYGASVGKVLTNKSGAYNVAVMKTIPNEKFLDRKYFYFYLISDDFQSRLMNVASRSAQDGFSKNDIFDFPVPLPPLIEQQRIVSLLDSVFAAITKAKANAEKNLQNAKELFKSYLQSVFEQNGIDTKYVRLFELADSITDGDHMPPPKSSSGIPFITISNINKESNQIDFSDTFTVSQDYFQNLKASRVPKKGDVLYTVTGSYGIPVLIETDKQFCFQRHIGLIRPLDSVNSKWLFFWILSPQALRQAHNKATGTAQKTVSLNSLRNFMIPKVPSSRQSATVKELDTLLVKTKRLESIYQKKLKDLEELKKSFLQKAFNGELKIIEKELA